MCSNSSAIQRSKIASTHTLWLVVTGGNSNRYDRGALHCVIKTADSQTQHSRLTKSSSDVEQELELKRSSTQQKTANNMRRAYRRPYRLPSHVKHCKKEGKQAAPLVQPAWDVSAHVMLAGP